MGRNDPDLSIVFWICGTSSGGKTTVARILGARLGMDVYGEEHRQRHRMKASRFRSPVTFKLWRSLKKGGTIADLFLLPSDRLSSQMIAYWNEEFRHVLRDLARVPTPRRMIVEGNAALPHLVAEAAGVRQAVCLVATPEFQKADFLRRVEENAADHPAVQSFITHPRRDEVIRNRIEVYAWQVEYVLQMANAVGLKVIMNDGERDLTQLVSEVQEHLGLG
jgi:adenylate kinase family enzyme